MNNEEPNELRRFIQIAEGLPTVDDAEGAPIRESGGSSCHMVLSKERQFSSWYLARPAFVPRAN